ncbi:phage tail sheath family protein [Candidatus Accumulibacter phosphatis]|uniref:Phage tail sheath family protein n=1 Tax=Candidatus Accumulibacter phosphatis TaxID=327160 RepID=A0ABX1TQX2_9PROT|nr:phage tail sheath C-terminal domain-containing protein [Candidatus Accumulibacter phosphatis]NMQ26636.1 phage tail sheath family protein [Candidatus Accumulibacter phosphatis]
MPEYLSPGVYVEEVSSGIKPVEGVGTSTGAFVGIAQRGPIGKPRLITNWTQFTATFGGFVENGYLAYAVYQFFSEGGTRCYVIRAAKGSATTLKKAETAAMGSLVVRANSEGIWGNALSAVVADETTLPGGSVRIDYFQLSIVYDGAVVEAFDNVTLDEARPDHVLKRVDSKWVEMVDNGATRPPNGTTPLAGGLDGDTLLSSDWAGATGFINSFDPVDDINIVAIPDALGNATVTQNAYTYCYNRKDCFFVADTPQNLDAQGAAAFRMVTGNFNSSYAAIYYPWISISDPLTGKSKLTPPSGAIAGIYSHTDVARGVHKAPAGIEVGYLKSAIGLERVITKGEHDTLNPIGVNVIRSFPGAGSVVWGARTLSADSEWKYVNVRRLFLFLEETIDEGTQWVVFEPNTPMLWGRVKRNITAFLTNVWRDGALFGTSAAEAFFVKVDAENNPPEVVDAGRLIIEVGVAPVKPAEFVIIRISQKTLGKAG